MFAMHLTKIAKEHFNDTYVEHKKKYPNPKKVRTPHYKLDFWKDLFEVQLFVCCLLVWAYYFLFRFCVYFDCQILFDSFCVVCAHFKLFVFVFVCTVF